MRAYSFSLVVLGIVAFGSQAHAAASDPFQNGNFNDINSGPLGISYASQWGDGNPAGIESTPSTPGSLTVPSRVDIEAAGLSEKVAHLRGGVIPAPNYYGGTSTTAIMQQRFDGLADGSSIVSGQTYLVDFFASGFGASLIELCDGCGTFAMLTDRDARPTSNPGLDGNGHNAFVISGPEVFQEYSYSFTAGASQVLNIFFKSDSSFYVNDVTITAFTPTTAVPEPETYAMMLAGLGALGFMARRRKSS